MNEQELLNEGRELLASLSEIWGEHIEQIKSDLGFISDNSSFSSFINLASRFVIQKADGTTEFQAEQFEKLYSHLHQRHGEFLGALTVPNEAQNGQPNQ